MLPLLAIGGVIGAVMSIAKGGSWVADQVSDKGAASAGGKTGPKPLTEAQASSFAATLAAQNAGQTLPASAASPSSPAVSVAAQECRGKGQGRCVGLQPNRRASRASGRRDQAAGQRRNRRGSLERDRLRRDRRKA